MSGGKFDYQQHRIQDIINTIQDEIDANNEKPEYWWGEWNGQVYSDETIAEFKKGIELLKKAYVYAQRIDWLLSGDDGEEDFHKRLKNELKNIDENGKN